jgi:chemotaxis protein CheC
MEINPVQIDALKEISSIGAGNAATALNQFINQTVRMSPPEVSVAGIDDVPVLISSEVPIITLVVLEVSGPVSGFIFFIFDEKNAVSLIDLLMAQPQGSTVSLTDLEVSALKEVSSVMSGSYVHVLGDMLNITVRMEPPYFTAGSTGEITDFFKEHCIKEGEQTISLSSVLSIGANMQAAGRLVFIPSSGSLDVLLSMLGI